MYSLPWLTAEMCVNHRKREEPRSGCNIIVCREHSARSRPENHLIKPFHQSLKSMDMCSSSSFETSTIWDIILYARDKSKEGCSKKGLISDAWSLHQKALRCGTCHIK